MLRIINLSDLGDEIVIFGNFSDKDIQKVIDIAEKNNMTCLSYIDLQSDTYFNSIQCAKIKEELKILNTYKDINKNFLETLLVALEYSIETGYYIKIERLKNEC